MATNPVSSYVNRLVEKKFNDLAAEHGASKEDVRAVIEEFVADAGLYVVGKGMPYETLQAAVDAAPKETSEFTGDEYGESGFESAAKILVTEAYDSRECGETFPVRIDKKQIDVHGYARGGARIVGDMDKPIFSVTGVGSYDYRNCRKFTNLRTYHGDPVFKVDSENGLIVRDVVMQGPVRGAEVWAGADDHMDSVVNRFENIHVWWPKDDAFQLRAKSASNANHFRGVWIHGAGKSGGSGRPGGVGIKVHGAACSITDSVIEQVGGKALDVNECTALTMAFNYFEGNADYRNGDNDYPRDVDVQGTYGLLAMGNYFNGSGGTMRALNLLEVESPTLIGNVFNNYRNSKKNGDEGHAVGIHGKAPGITAIGNVSLLDKGGKARAEILSGMNYSESTTVALNNIGADGLGGNHDTEDEFDKGDGAAMSLPGMASNDEVDEAVGAVEETVGAVKSEVDSTTSELGKVRKRNEDLTSEVTALRSKLAEVANQVAGVDCEPPEGGSSTSDSGGSSGETTTSDGSSGGSN